MSKNDPQVSLDERVPSGALSGGSLTPWGGRAFVMDAFGGLHVLREQMVREMGLEFTSDIFYRAGSAGAERLTAYVEAQNPVAERTELLESALTLLTQSGYGRLEQQNGRGGEVAIHVENSLEGDMMRDQAGRADYSCDYLRGLLRGIVQALPTTDGFPQGAVECVEISCIANDAAECRFLIASPDHLAQHGYRQGDARHTSVRETLLRLNRQLEDVLEAAKRDSLTSLYNRAHFESVLRNKIEYANRRTDTLAVAMIDVDGFKEVNDGLGHGMGDLALRQVGHLLAAQARDTDLVARYGGDEFAWMMPGTSIEAAMAVADRIRKRVHEMQRGRELPISLSIGIASCPQDAVGMSELIDFADAAMYQAKGAGGNQVRRFSASDDLRGTPQKRFSRPRRRSGSPAKPSVAEENTLRLDIEDPPN